jgi:hypothetical protein
LPAHVTFVSAESTKGSCSGPSVVSCLLGTLRPGAMQPTNVVLTNRIPVRATLVSATASQGSCSGTAAATCSLGTLAGGRDGQVTIVVPPTAAGYLINRASVRVRA